MPLPTPKPKEKSKDFVGRFMGDKEANKTFPDQKQRAAVAYQTYRDSKKKSKKMETKTFEEGETTIPGVFILSEGEAKGHDLYVDSVSLEKAHSLMAKAKNGVKVKMNHGSGLDAVVGFARNPRIEGDKLVADLHLLKSSPHYNLIKEMASEAPDQFGVSLAFMNETETIKGKDYIRPTKVESADLVSSPAANTSLFEQMVKFMKKDEKLGYYAGGMAPQKDIQETIVEAEPHKWVDNKENKNMDKKYMDEMSELKARLEALEAAMKTPNTEKTVAPSDKPDDTAKEAKQEGEPYSVEKDEQKKGFAEVLKATLIEFGIKPLTASPAVELSSKKEEPKTFEELVAAHSDYKTSKLKAINAVMLSNPNEYAEAKARGISKI
jgi:hypothetical protein